MNTMPKMDLLTELDLAGIVAEHDSLLATCFISHPVLMDVVKDQKDLVLGAKGAGKSAVWKEIFEHQQNYHQLADVRMRVIANPSGDPEFRDVLSIIAKSGEEFDEDSI